LNDIDSMPDTESLPLAPEETVKVVPGAPKVTLARFAVKFAVSEPLPPTIESFPAPRARASLPARPSTEMFAEILQGISFRAD
jgi:hypothetical protein